MVEEVVRLGPDQHLFLNFKLKNSVSGRNVPPPQQVFGRFFGSGIDVYLVAKVGAGNLYEFHLDAALESPKFSARSGDYVLSLMIGDWYISNPLHWNVTTVTVNFEGQVGSTVVTLPSVDPFTPLPVITHRFAPPQVHAPSVVSIIYTVGALLPLLVLFYGVLSWSRFSSVSGGSRVFSTGLFLVMILASFTWIVYYWFYLRLFQGIVGLLVMSLPLSLSGNAALVALVHERRV
eukprot:TRINITY_DN7204_c0_g1_i1.p1 TRINITY_DN7204_c0_g1~~TRINITY_DN7204_c0_g1_i1.p1  ORF type:complete len:234 (-),score=46.24 TRINITY_DN7204_c0_g1_i1:236-937(-)